jgi:hypothetical protein
MATLLTWQDDAGQTEFVQFDVVTVITHEGTVEVTEHPVEEGSDIADHARPVPEFLSIEGFVSNKPMASNPGVDKIASFRQVDLKYPPHDPPLNLSIGQAITGAIDAITGKDPFPAQVTALAFDTFVNRIRQIAEKLEDARLNSRLIRVYTSLREYENMVLLREAEPITADDGSGCTFQVDLKRIRIVTAETVEAPQPAEARGATTKAKGSKAGQQADNQEAKQEQLRSIAASLFTGSSPLAIPGL